MFARVLAVEVKPDKIDEVITNYGRYVVRAAKTQKGYKGILMLTDRKTGKGISITLWEDKQDAIPENSIYYKTQVGRFKDYATKPAIQESYEVSIIDLPVKTGS